MSSRRRMGAATLIAVGLLTMALTAPVSAGKPIRGCSDGKALLSVEQFRALSLSVGVPAEILGADWEAGLRASFDKNGDSHICVKDLPDTNGHLGTWVFNVVDNTSNGG